MPMSPREKKLLAGAVAVLVLVCLAQFVGRPVLRRVALLQRSVTESESALRQLQAKSAEYAALQSGLAALRGKAGRAPEQGGALSALERMQKECGLGANVMSMRPETAPFNDALTITKVTVRMEGASLEQVTQLLRRIESGDSPLGVRALQLRTAAKNAALLDVVLEVVAVAAKG